MAAAFQDQDNFEMANPENFKTPLPWVPEFYPSNSTCYSTKKERKTPKYRQLRPPPMTAPPAYASSRYRSQKPHRISFRYDKRLSGAFYDETKSETYFKQCFTIESKLGEGSFGKVYKARSKEDHRLYAVKKAMEPFRNETDRGKKLNEVAKHETLPKHPNLVRFIKAWEERGRLYIQTELCKMSLSDLCDCLHDIPESLIWKYLVDLLLAVKHLHDHDLVHMDIKPANIFISDDGVCKLGDFGLVIELKRDSLEDVGEGDAMYLAEEVLSGYIGKHADIFSLGITMLEISTDLDLPQEGEIWHSLRRGELPMEMLKGRSTELCEVISIMMEPDYTQRPSASEILALPYVNSVWRWRRLYVNYCQIMETVKSCRFLMWAYFTFFGRNAASARAFFRLANGQQKVVQHRSPANDSSYDGLFNGNVTKELKIDTSSDDEYSRDPMADLSAIDHDDNSFSTPPMDPLREEVQTPEFSSPDAPSSASKQRLRFPGRPLWNSTPDNENRMRRRIAELKSPNDLKRLRSDRVGNGTCSPLRLNRITSQDNSFNDSGPLACPYTMPNIRYGRNGSITDSPDSSRSMMVPPKMNLIDAFDADSETEIEL